MADESFIPRSNRAPVPALDGMLDAARDMIAGSDKFKEQLANADQAASIIEDAVRNMQSNSVIATDAVRQQEMSIASFRRGISAAFDQITRIDEALKPFRPNDITAETIKLPRAMGPRRAGVASE